MQHLFIAGLLFVAATLRAATVYDESGLGDLSNSGLSPTLITLGAGSNQVSGTTGRDTVGVDRDYLTFILPAGSQLTSIVLLPGTAVGGIFSFIGMQAGDQVTLANNAVNATGLLGWTHYAAADVGTDLLPKMGVADSGSTGFTPPLGPGQYAFWIQDFNAGPLAYGFDFQVSSPGAVPEPGTWMTALMGLCACAGVRRSQRH